MLYSLATEKASQNKIQETHLSYTAVIFIVSIKLITHYKIDSSVFQFLFPLISIDATY